MSTRRGKSGSSLLVAFLAAIAVLAQTLVPAIAMARSTTRGEAIVICTVEGAKLVRVGGDKPVPDKMFGGFKCGQCVAASLAAVTPDPAATVVPVRYAARIEVAVVRVLGVRGHARAPPRPPGQGPPILLNV
jgi:hypothetical protein